VGAAVDARRAARPRWDHATRSGYVTVVRQGGGPLGPQTLDVHLRDTDPSRTYTLTDVRTGEVLGRATGASLAAGYPVTMSDRYRSRVLEVSAAGPTAALPEGPLLLALPLVAGAAVLLRRRVTASRAHRPAPSC